MKEFTQSVAKEQRETVAGIAEFSKNMREIEAGGRLARSGTETMQKNFDVLVGFHVEALKRCVDGIR